MAVGKFAEGAKNEWYYFDKTGKAVTGLQKIGKQTLYFDQDGKQVKGKVVTLADKSIRYFDANSGEMATNKFVEGSQNEWYYFDQAGKAVTGLQQVGQQTLYFTQDGKQVKGKLLMWMELVDISMPIQGIWLEANGFNLKMEVGCILTAMVEVKTSEETNRI